MTLSCHDGDAIWSAPVYFGVDEGGVIYFVSPQKALHSSLILKNPLVAFSTVWFDPADHKNRKAIQGLGACHIAKDDLSIAVGVQLHNKNFPEFKNRITVEWIKNNDSEARVWMLRPSKIKYWDDELYGKRECEEFILP